MEQCLESVGRINLIVASKNNGPQWLDLDQARSHCRAGAGVWDWAGTEQATTQDNDLTTVTGDVNGVPADPDVVLACAGTVPTVETLAAAQMLRRDAPDLRVRVTNVVDLLALPPADRHPHGLSEGEFACCFGGDQVPVVFDFHGYPSAVHECLHGRGNAARFHVKGYIEEGTTTTPYDLLASNGVSRHDLAIEALRRATGWSERGSELAEQYARERDDIRTELRRTGQDPDGITNWTWNPAA